MEHVIVTQGLQRRFGDRVAVADIDLAVPSGCCFGLLGPNGAGKTTLIRLLLGLLGATGGQASVLGHRLPGGRREALARVGAIVEEPRFHGHLTGRENLLVHAAARDLGAERRIPASLERVGLTDRADERVRGYSLGMRQRLALARCLLADPLLLILDEPMNGLDPAGVLELRALLRAFVDEGRTVLVSSHLLDEVERTCDQVAIMAGGRLIAQESIADLASREAPVEIVCDDPFLALATLSGSSDVTVADRLDDTRLAVTLSEHGSIAAVVRSLVLAGIEIDGVERARHTLEDRFLALTSTTGDPR
ncbi:MAG: ATP-binding cassette domain-containing protein [Gaiellales bacterium]